jgi:hypothetical protein
MDAAPDPVNEMTIKIPINRDALAEKSKGKT